jgi:chorismate dehydratase
VEGLGARPDELRLLFDLPSRLADSLAAGRVDVALVPSIEFFRNPIYTIVSDACIACRGPVLSVKLFFRVPPCEVQRVALDEGSRTSAALAQILLGELAGVSPALELLPIGATAADTDADAVLLIGDRAIRAVDETFADVWDLGERWVDWTGLPFVFAMWVARTDVDVSALSSILAAARDEGVKQLDAIADREATLLEVDAQVARRYLHDNLHFTLGQRERMGLERYYQLCAARGLVPPGCEKSLAAARHA